MRVALPRSVRRRGGARRRRGRGRANAGARAGAVCSSAPGGRGAHTPARDGAWRTRARAPRRVAHPSRHGRSLPVLAAGTRMAVDATRGWARGAPNCFVAVRIRRHGALPPACHPPTARPPPAHHRRADRQSACAASGTCRMHSSRRCPRHALRTPPPRLTRTGARGARPEHQVPRDALRAQRAARRHAGRARVLPIRRGTRQVAAMPPRRTH